MLLATSVLDISTTGDNVEGVTLVLLFSATRQSLYTKICFLTTRIQANWRHMETLKKAKKYLPDFRPPQENVHTDTSAHQRFAQRSN